MKTSTIILVTAGAGIATYVGWKLFFEPSGGSFAPAPGAANFSDMTAGAVFTPPTFAPPAPVAPDQAPPSAATYATLTLARSGRGHF